ncbi:MAG: hypothetical protein ABIJ09_13140 [Pseudomonadota bacterium]
MTNEQAVLEVLSYNSNVGTTLDDAWRGVAWRTKGKPTKKQLLELLRKLERDGALTSVGERWFFTPAARRRAKGSQRPAEWLDADALILLAALYSCRREAQELDALISTADYFNHAIPTHDELHGAINRLISGRLLKTTRGKLVVTPRAIELFEKIEATGHRAALRQLNRLQRLLDCPCCGVGLKAVRWSYVLDAATYAEAVKKYRARFRAAV